MKKLLALLLAALMLLGMTAVAETAGDQPSALICTIDNVNITTTQNGETAEVPMQDFAVQFALDAAEDPTLAAGAFKGDESLAFAMAKLSDGKALVSLYGLDETYEAEIPEQYAEQIATLGPNLKMMLPLMLTGSMPMISIPSMGKIDLSALVGAFATDTTQDGDATSIAFEVPEAVVSALLDQIVQAAGSAEGTPAASFVDMINGLKESGMAISLKGNLKDTPDEQTAEIGVYLSTEDAPAEAPAVVLSTDSVQDKLSLTLSMPSGEDMFDMANVVVTTDADANAMALNLDMMGMITAELTIGQADDAQNIAVKFDAIGTSASFSTTYATAEDGSSFANTSLVFGDTNIDLASQGTRTETTYTGTIGAKVTTQDNQFEFNADYYEELGTYDSGNEMPAEIAPIEELDQGRANEAIKPLIDYFTSVFTPNAA